VRRTPISALHFQCACTLLIALQPESLQIKVQRIITITFETVVRCRRGALNGNLIGWLLA
jgi:hypothetical protein